MDDNSNDERREILARLEQLRRKEMVVDDKEIISKKRTLTYYVPYRLQSPFMRNMNDKDWNVGENELISRLNQEKRLIYYFSKLKGLATVIRVQEDWANYIQKNQEIIRG